MRPERNAKSQQKLALMRCERDSAPGFHLELPLSAEAAQWHTNLSLHIEPELKV